MQNPTEGETFINPRLNPMAFFLSPLLSAAPVSLANGIRQILERVVQIREKDI